MSDEQDEIDNLLADIDIEDDELETNRSEKPAAARQETDLSNDDEDSLEVEYIRFDNPVYHLKYNGIDRTFCGLSTERGDFQQSNREPDLLDPCKPCHGESRVTTNKEIMVELREQLCETVPAIDVADTNPGQFTVAELDAIRTALPTDVDNDSSDATAIRAQLSRVVKGLRMNVQDPGEFDKEELDALVKGLSGEGVVSNDPHIFIRTNDDLIKRTPLSAFSHQKRGGKGQTGIDMAEHDCATSLWVGNPRDTLLVFTNQGQVHEVNGYEIPNNGRVKSGTPAHEVINLDPQESIQAVIPVVSLEDAEYLVMATRDGYVKRTATNQFKNIHRGGIRAIELHDDELRDVQVTDGAMDLLLETQQGHVIRFDETELRPMGRSAKGPRGIKLEHGDQVVGVEAIQEASANQILTVTKNGYGKRTDVQRYRRQSRFGKGLLDISTGERNGAVVDISTVTDDDVVVLSERGQVIYFSAEDISVQGRDTMGMLIMEVDDGDRIASFDTVSASHPTQ